LLFYYTQFFKAHRYGGPVVIRFPFGTLRMMNCIMGDNLNANFIIGKSLLVVPALDYNEQQKVTVYLPNQNWYHFTDYSLVSQFDPDKKLGKTVQLDANLENVNLLIRGGSIVPFQNTATVYPPKI
jgi:alpha-glucosidase (family GH31 glycosyl hydrolase)